MKACGFKPLTILALREKCPNKEFPLVRVFSHLYWTRRFTPYSVFIYLYNYFIYSVQMRNTDQKKLRIWTIFRQWKLHHRCWKSSFAFVFFHCTHRDTYSQHFMRIAVLNISKKWIVPEYPFTKAHYCGIGVFLIIL